MLKIIELTEDNEQHYLDQIVNLEQIALEFMKKEGREGQLFATGRDDILKYIHSNENIVVVAIEDDDQVKATAYLTQGQEPFTYNDITKYFKCGEEYQKYVESQYEDSIEYKKDLIDIYKIKLKAFEYAKNIVLKEYPQMKNFMELLDKEVRRKWFS